ncbi:MAG: glutathione peroxidase [Breznakibacter sp.]
MDTDFYSLTAKTLQGKEFSLSELKGKTVLVVNTASKCGLTPQYEGLESLYRKYNAHGLEILGFPCNQFGNQEPGDAKQISEGCLINYGVSFRMFEKVDVNGTGTHPVFKWLKKQLPGWFGNRVKWNFTKFLLDKNGKPVKRFAPVTTPAKMEAYIKRALEID